MWSCEICDSDEFVVHGESVLCSGCDSSFPLDSRLENVTVDETDVTGGPARLGSRNKKRKKLRGIAEKMKKEKLIKNGIEVTNEDSFTTTGVYIEDRSRRSRKAKVCLSQLEETVSDLNKECGYGILLVASAVPPEQGPRGKCLRIVLPDKNGNEPKYMSNSDQTKKVNRGTMCYKAFPENYQKKLTPKNARTLLARNQHQVENPSYVSPFAPSLNLSIQREEANADIDILEDDIDMELPERADVSEREVVPWPSPIVARKSKPVPSRISTFIPPTRSTPITTQNKHSECELAESMTSPSVLFGHEENSDDLIYMAPTATTVASFRVSEDDVEPSMGEGEPVDISLATNHPTRSNHTVFSGFDLLHSKTTSTSWDTPSLNYRVALEPDFAAVNDSPACSQSTSKPLSDIASMSSMAPTGQLVPAFGSTQEAQDGRRVVAFNPIKQITISGLGKSVKPANQDISLGLPSIICVVCGVERKSSKDVAHRIDDLGRKKGPGRVCHQWVKCRGSPGPCSLWGHASCLYSQRLVPVEVKTRKMLDELVFTCFSHTV